jgi:nicotinate-nucleotide--dimethylbenzimidazole phosphoribosyltransferase
MPHWALGRVLDLAEQVSACTGFVPPEVSRRVVVVMAADHGVAAEGVSLYPQEVTVQMMANFVAGGAGINALSKVGKARLLIADLGVKSDIHAMTDSGKVLDRKVAPGTGNMAVEVAMTREQAYQAVAAGMELALDLSTQNDILAAGEMGIANTTSATALVCALTGLNPQLAVGAGTGLDEAGRKHKAEVILKALQLHKPNKLDAFDILSKVGGFEIAGIAGFYLGIAASKKIALVDGFICSSAAMIAQALCPISTKYMVAAHRSGEAGHGYMTDALGLQPLLNLGFRLGEGTGAAMAMPIFDAARAMLTDVATFEEAAVSDKDSVKV